jgi:hypothetical protein
MPPWFLEVQFSGGQWQRNPQAFTTQDEADRAGQVFLAQNQITANMNATFRELGIQISSLQYRITQE